MTARAVTGAIQHYDWGDSEFIPQMFGLSGDESCWAELWLGTHPNGPTTFDDGTPLEESTGPLHYLLKVLSAARPLSLQAHPSTEQARSGHANGVFGDPYAKPELLVALTDFEALCGFRPVATTLDFLRPIGADGLADVVAEHGSGEAMRRLYRHEIEATTVLDGLDAASVPTSPQLGWVGSLRDRYGDDPSVVVTLLLNYVALAPGEALHLTAGNLHAYLGGSGIELLGASDNVVRGGLTSKHVDVDLLLDIVDPTPLDEPIMTITDGRYPLPEAGVVLLKLEPGATHTSTGHELAITVDGTTLYLSPGTTFRADAVTYVVTST